MPLLLLFLFLLTVKVQLGIARRSENSNPAIVFIHAQRDGGRVAHMYVVAVLKHPTMAARHTAHVHSTVLLEKLVQNLIHQCLCVATQERGGRERWARENEEGDG